MEIESYRDLRGWQAGMELAKSRYALTSSFPKVAMLGMVCQIRRAATSIPANIAEGNGREHTKGYIQFLRIAQGSSKELETHLMLLKEVSISTPEAVSPLLSQADDVGRMLRALIRALQARLE